MAQDEDNIVPDPRNSIDYIENERSPLIRSGSDDCENVQGSRWKSSALRPLGMMMTCFLLNILMEFGLFLITIPLCQALEGIICRNALLPDIPTTNDLRCKDKLVQSELSLIRGWQTTLDVMPGLLTAIPYGLMADKFGREFVYGLSVLSGALTSTFNVLVCTLPNVFPPRMIWFSSVFGFIGGGATVFNAITFAILSSVVGEKQRSITFFYMTATIIGSQLLASPLVYLLLNINTWLPMYCGLGCLWLAAILAMFLPRIFAESQYQTHSDTSLPTKIESPGQTAREQLMAIGTTAMWFARGNILVTVLLLTYLVTTLGRLAQDILLQYITKRYGWSWAQAGLLLSFQSFSTLTLLMIILPVASQTLARKTTLSTQSRNLWLARISVFMSTFGCFTIGLSEAESFMYVGLASFALGYGYSPLVRSLLASIIDKRHFNMMYTTISIFETMGSVVAGPLLAASFRTGLEWGNAWIGLPFLVAGCLFGSAAIAVSVMNRSSLERRATDS